MATASSLPPCVKLTGGKRGAPGPLIVTTSDEDSASDGESILPASPRAVFTSRISPRANLTENHPPNLKLDLTRVLFDRSSDKSMEIPESFRYDRNSEHKCESRSQYQGTSRTVSPPPSGPGSNSHHQQACDGYEHDHDYENVASPSGSSTASGPVYIRPPGFQHHAQEIRRKKKKSPGLLDRREGLKSRAPTPPKVKPRREPLPMKLRALPQSFWKQPNNPPTLSPGNLFSSLPPLSSMKDDDVTDVRPITPPEDKEKSKRTSKPERKLIITQDTDLFLKQLFANVMEEKKSSNNSNAAHLKRGRPPKKAMLPNKTGTKVLISGDDPYLIDSSVTRKRFPQLSMETSMRQGHAGNSSLQLITLREGDKSVTLPSLSINQDYSQMLSELVMNI